MSDSDISVMHPEPILSIRDLAVDFPTPNGGWRRVVDDLSLDVATSERMALVGESGSGKSVLALATLGLVSGSGRIRSGRITVDGLDLADADEDRLREIRGGTIGLVFQEASAALNPVLTVGFQIAETAASHRRLNRRQARIETQRLLDAVALEDAGHIGARYPHQLSGGQLQRVMIALALAGAPRLLIADEPTTALDVLTQAQILELLRKLTGDDMALLLISHDLAVVSGLVDRVAVMYAGQIIEHAPTGELFGQPLHPYTRQLLDAVNKGGHQRQSQPSQGQADASRGCRFAARCPIAEPPCLTHQPSLALVDDYRAVRCPVTVRGMAACGECGTTHV